MVGGYGGAVVAEFNWCAAVYFFMENVLNRRLNLISIKKSVLFRNF